MSDKILTDAEFREIGTWFDPEQVYVPTSDGMRLYESHHGLAAKLAEAERKLAAALEVIRISMEVIDDV